MKSVFFLLFISSLVCAPLAQGLSIIDLQKDAKSEEKVIPQGNSKTVVTLVNLNPNINSWFLYRYTGKEKKFGYHLENPQPESQRLSLSQENTTNVSINNGGVVFNCDLNDEEIRKKVSLAGTSGESYIPICGNRLLIRGKVKGRQSTKEMVAGFLRSYIWHGEDVTSFIKETLFKDKFLIDDEATTLPENEDSMNSADQEQKEELGSKNAQRKEDPETNENFNSVDSSSSSVNKSKPKTSRRQKMREKKALLEELRYLYQKELRKHRARPLPAKIAEASENLGIENEFLGISFDGSENGILKVGEWYPTSSNEDVWVSAIKPAFVDENILSSYTARVNPLDKVEANATTILIAFNLDTFSMGFAVGTENPSLEWSDRTIDNQKNNLPGPDGIGSIEPLIGTGRVPPYLLTRMVAAFAGGFKRSHSAFKWGPLSRKNHGSHYGFVEQGVVMSTLQPDLATLIITDNDEVIMKTWTESDSKTLLNHVKHARQNGVPLTEGLDSSEIPIPGEYVKMWGEGNWSGSIDNKQRALRAGLCLQKKGTHTYLIFGYFSSATANAMARVFQSYSCEYAFHLDMNALEHTYLALYSTLDQQFTVEHLIQGMEVLDYNNEKLTLSRFLHFSDNRDMFYIYKKEDN